MPMYEYRCPSCTTLFERLGAMSERDDQVRCPRCGREAERLFSTFAAFTGADGGASSAAGGGCCGGAGGCACRA